MNKKGLAQIPLMIGLLIMAIAVPIATRLAQQNQDTRNMAAYNPTPTTPVCKTEGQSCANVTCCSGQGLFCNSARICAKTATPTPVCKTEGQSCANVSCCNSQGLFCNNARICAKNVTPTPTNPPNVCSQSPRPNGCNCTIGSQCSSGYCSETGKCENPPIITEIPSVCTQCAGRADAKSKGDADCSGTTTLNDFSIWRSEFISSSFGELVKNNWKADFDCNGKVNIIDISIWRDNFIKSL